MKLLHATFVFLLAGAVSAFAQGPGSTSVFGGQRNAIDYAYGYFPSAPGSLSVSTGNTITGSTTITLVTGAVALPGGGNFYPLAVNTPINVGSAANTEKVTPTAVSGCSSSGALYSCQVTASFTKLHGTGDPVASATFGLQEAINAAAFAGGGMVLASPAWASAGGTTAIITAAQLSGYTSGLGPNNGLPPVVTILDTRTLPLTYWGPRPTTKSLIAAGAALTLTGSAGGALTNSGTYYVSYEYVDALGGISLPATDSAQITLSSQNTITTSVPVAPAGAVGWIPMITASAGGTGSEIEVPVTSSVCTVATSLVSTLKPVCSLTSAAVIAANPSSTAKEVVEGTAHTTFAPQPFSSVPPPFQTQYGPFVATATLNSSNADAAQFYTPPGYFNYLGKAWDICVKGATATQVGTSVLTVNLKVAKQYGQSPVTVSSILFPTKTTAAAATFGGCWRLQTDTTGTSGAFWSTSPLAWYDALNSAPGTTPAQSIDVTTAASSAVDLTAGLYWSVNLQETIGANITGPIINALSIMPVNGN